MWPSKQARVLPDNISYTSMVPCASRGRFKPWVYLLEFLVSFWIVVQPDYGLWIGLPVMAHGVYRLANNNRFQASCPSCKITVRQLLENGKPFKCKSCGHRLGIFGTKMADFDSPVRPPEPKTQEEIKTQQADANFEEHVAAASEESANRARTVVGALVFIGLLVWFFGGGLDWQAEQSLQQIENKVAADAVDQYGIASRNGNRIDKCVHAGLVAAAFMQANDEGSYAHWKNVRDRDCAAAGIPPN